MELILKEDVINLGQAGEVVRVKDGYGRNYLIPQNLADLADKKNIKAFEAKKKRIEKNKQAQRAQFEDLVKKLEGIEITIEKQVGAEDKIFGSVTSKDVSELLSAQGFKIQKKYIHILDPIKTIGEYEVPVKLLSDLEAKIKLWVVRSGEKK